ncbi:ATP-binding cassette domain-containing protein [Microbulbifer sp. Q7]|uniref:ABC transporter ATP-binding protein n=1 Tax=Microbulbifer sp. Q7 TaxID=1785091 RepID=UPI000B0C87C2|nr:ATP-binding cassette domain-containing protein [Microbulbifer sp. Q7]
MNTANSLDIAQLAIGDLKPVDLTIAPGEIVCLSGTSGIGKSRLLRAITDMELHSGEVHLGNQARAAMPAHRWRQAVMMVPADSAWWGETVGEHFPEGTTVPDALGLAEECMMWPVSRLSSGEKQRLALLRALARDPCALLLDEPTANLDEDTTEQVEHWLQEEIQNRQLPVLWVAHARAQITRVAQRHFHLDDEGSMEERTV